MPLEDLELAELHVPDDPRTRAHLAELTRLDGRELEPAETYEARDPSGFVIVTVNKNRKVTNVRVRARWFEHLRPEHFPAALYNTYVTAVQRAFAVEFAHRPPEQPSAPPPAAFADPVRLSPQEWQARTTARINAMADQYDAIRRRQHQQKPLEVTDIRSPLGYLTLQVRAGGPVAIHGDPQALDNPSDTVLSEEALQLFVRAGLGIDPGERPPARPHGRGGSDEDDDAYFSDFNVLRGRDQDGQR
ncbi:hypothetical protein ABZX92_16405 [Lentzea sp. NPDC006480]|uniref:hypothetical protein n=1 Tax=Lentzea sp. NPDC006480 TaxID=3157176 RepID=UPI0033A16CC7